MTIPHNKYRLQVISTGLQLYFCTRNDAADPVITSLRLYPAVSRVDRSVSVSEDYIHLEEMSWTVVGAY